MLIAEVEYVVHKRAATRPNGTLCGSAGFRLYLSHHVTCEECKRLMEKRNEYYS